MTDDSDQDPLDAALDTRGRSSVAAFVVEEVVHIAPDASLRDAAVALRTADASFAVVGVEDDLEGVISERDLVAAIALDRDIDATPVSTIESDSLLWATVSSTVDDVAEEMLETYVRHILVRDEDGSLAGVVSMRDLLAAYLV